MKDITNFYNFDLYIHNLCTYDGEFDYSLLGVRSEDFADASHYESTWYTQCKVITPLWNFSYNDVWDYIDYFRVPENPLYSLGYSSVGITAK